MVAERGIRRSAAIATTRATAIRARGRPLRPGEDAALTQAAAARHDRDRRPRRWAGAAVLAAAAFIGCAVAVTVVEQAAGKPLSALVQGKPGHGTTLGGGVSGRSSPVLAAYLSAHRTMINGSALCAALARSSPGDRRVWPFTWAFVLCGAGC